MVMYPASKPLQIAISEKSRGIAEKDKDPVSTNLQKKIA